MHTKDLKIEMSRNDHFMGSNVHMDKSHNFSLSWIF